MTIWRPAGGGGSRVPGGHRNETRLVGRHRRAISPAIRDEPGVVRAGGKCLVVDEPAQEAGIGLDPADERLVERARRRSTEPGRSTAWTISFARAVYSDRGRWSASTGRPTRMPGRQPSARGDPAGGRADPRKGSSAYRRTSIAWPWKGGASTLSGSRSPPRPGSATHEVEAGDELGDAVLNLSACSSEEIGSDRRPSRNSTVAALWNSTLPATDGHCRGARLGSASSTPARATPRKLLVAALDAAIPLAVCREAAMPIAEQLDLDVPCGCDHALRVDRPSPNADNPRGERPPRHPDAVGRPTHVAAPSPALRRSLQHER